jgi:hypothetical protein
MILAYPMEMSDGASMATGLGPAGRCQPPHAAAGQIHARMAMLVAVAALVFPPFGIPAVRLLRAAGRAAVAHDRVGFMSALRRARCWALAAVAAAVVVVVAVPVGTYLWGEATATCVCMSSIFEQD